MESRLSAQLLLATAFAAWWHLQGGASAQVATNITASTGGASTGTSVSSLGPQHTIDGGTLHGANLFHNFQTFDLASGHTARWTRSGGGAAAISNVINRVIGGFPSQISGTIDASLIPNADFYFINPSGIVLGPTAVVNVPHAFHLSTANELRFADGVVLSATSVGGSTFTSASPEAFGFVGPGATLRISGARLDDFVPTARVSFTAGRLEVIDGARIDVASGQLFLAAAQQGVLRFNDLTQPLSGLSLGDILIGGQSRVFSDATVTLPGSAYLALIGRNITLTGDVQVTSDNVAAGAGGRVVLRASGDVTIDEGSVLRASALETGAAIGVQAQIGGALRIDGQGRSDVTGIISASQPRIGVPVGGSGGTIDIIAGSIDLLRGGQIQAISNVRGGNSGALTITSGAIRLDGAGAGVLPTTISSSLEPGAFGQAGNIFISATELTVLNGATVQSTTSSVGNGGAITLDLSGRLLLDGGNATAPTGVFTQSQTGAIGNAGHVVINAGEVQVRSGADISSSSTSQGGAGSVQIVADGLFEVLGSPTQASTGVFVQTGPQSQGRPGVISVSASRIVVGAGASVSSSTQSANTTSGVSSISLQATGAIDLRPGSIVTTESSAARGAGVIHLAAPQVTLDGANVLSTATSSGEAGAISIAGDTVSMTGGSRVSSTSSGGAGAPAGGVQITSDRILLSNLSTISSDSLFGPAGDIVLLLPTNGMLYLDGRTGAVSISTSSGPGTGGRITINDPAFLISDGAQILALGQAGGANVDIRAGHFVRSSDLLNLVLVDGVLILDTEILDPSGGLLDQDVSFVDAGSVLRGRCPVIAAVGRSSQFAFLEVGPFWDPAGDVAAGQCRGRSPRVPAMQ